MKKVGKYIVIERLGEGSFGEVSLIECEDGRQFARKKIVV